MGREDWRRVRLGDLIAVQHGFAFEGDYFADQPTSRVLVTPGSFEIGGGFKVTKPKFYAEGGPLSDRYVLQPGDLVVTMTDLSKRLDTLGYAALVPRSDDFVFLHNQRVGKVVVRDGVTTSPQFIHWVLRSPSYRQHVIATASGTSVKHTAPSRIESYCFNLPPHEEQERIAGVLDALDRKAIHNRALAVQLDSLAAAVYAASFKSMSEGGTPLGAATDVLLGGTPSRSREEYWGGDIPWISSGKANDFRVLQPSEYVTVAGLENSATKLLRAGTTIVAITGATMGKVSRLEIDACANQSIVGIVGTDGYPDDFLYFWMRQQVDALLTRQTGAAQQHVNKGDIASLRLPVTAKATMDEFCSKVAPMMKKIASLLAAADHLDELCRALLPGLISGRLPVAPTYVPPPAIAWSGVAVAKDS